MDINEWLKGGAFIVAVGLILVGIWLNPPKNLAAERETEFRKTCAEVGGKVVHNHKHLECLR